MNDYDISTNVTANCLPLKEQANCTQLVTSIANWLPSCSTENYLNSLFILEPMRELLENQDSTLCQVSEDIDNPLRFRKT